LHLDRRCRDVAQSKVRHQAAGDTLVLKRSLRIIVLCMLFAVAGIFFVQRTTTGALLAVAASGNTQCPLGLTMSSMDSVNAIRATEQKMRAGMRLVKDEGEIQMYDTPRGAFWMPATSAKMMPLVLAEMAEQIYGRGERAVQKGDVVLDCGADIGTFTRSALDRGAAKVVAIEPDPVKAPCLRRNFAKEVAEGRVILVHKGVWNEEGSLKLYGDTMVEHHNGVGVDVPLTTIDKIVAELGLARVDFIKMDIEGAEKPALAGGAATIRKFHPRMSIATEHLPDDATAIPQAIRAIVPNYREQCGPCEWAGGHIRPQVVYLF
jgi:FkbM family methyltransferase